MENTKKSTFIWHNFQSNIGAKFRNFLNQNKYCDVSLIAGNKVIRVHKIMLASCSHYFEQIFDSFNDTGSPQMIVLDQISYDDLVCVIDFCYNGKVEVLSENSEKFMKAAKMLQLKGISQAQQEIPDTSDSYLSPPQSIHSDSEEPLLIEVVRPDSTASISKISASSKASKTKLNKTRREETKIKLNITRRRHTIIKKSDKKGNFK